MSESKNKIISSYEEFYEGFEEKSLTVDQMFNDNSSGLWQPETNTFLDFYTLKSLFFTEEWVYILVDRIASKISSQYLRVMKDDIVDGKKISRPAEGHPAQKILDQPNEVQDYHTWMYSLVADDCVLGNSFNWFSKSLGQIIPIPGENCRPFFNGKGDLEKYVITQSVSEGQKPVSWSLSIDEICHIRRANPSSLYIGLSPFIAAQKSLLFSRYSAEYLNNFYIKGAQPGIVLEMSQDANQEMSLRLLRSMETAYTGRRNQRRNIVLPRGVKAAQMNVSMADQQLIALVNQNREKIINILQVPKHELSIAEAGSLGSEEYKTAIKNFWRGPLRSTMRRIAGSLTLKMKDLLGEGYYLEFDLSDIEYLNEDEGVKADTAAKMLSVHTVNEVRAKVYDLPPIPGGDATPGVAQYPQMAPMPIQEPEPSPIIEASGVVPENNKAMERADRFIKSNGGKWWEDRQAQEDSVISPAEEKMTVLTAALLDAQAKLAAAAYVRSSKKSYVKKETARELRKRISAELDKMEQLYVDGYGDALKGVVDMGYDTSLVLPFDMPNSEAIAALKDKNEDRRLSTLKARSIESFETINEPTTNKIMEIIAAGAEKSQSVKEIADSIKGYFKKDEALMRATRIARTETLTAVSLGQAAAMKDAAKATGEKIKKMWITAGDNRVRDKHQEVHGEIVWANEKFGNGLLYPRQPGGDADNVINCFPPETLVVGVGVEKLFSRLYDGPMVTINFKGGDKLSGTPNHPVLTPKGWVALGSLTKGSKVFKASGFDCSGIVDGNIKNIKTTFAELLGSFSGSLPAMSITGAIMDFHGDGTAENVDIINVETTLQDREKTSGFKEGKNLGFTNSDLTHGFGFSGSGESEPISGVGASHSSVSASDLLASSVHIESAPLQDFGFAPPTLGKSSVVESFDDGSSGDIFDPANLQYGEFINEVHLDEVVSVDVVSYHGYVYNLQTKGGYYIANNTIVHNCRCTWVMVPESEAERLDGWKSELYNDGV